MLSKQIALVTGANKGIGFEVSRQLAQTGIKVLMGARNEKNGLDAAIKLQEENLDVEFILLDVTNSEHIKNVREYIEQHFGKLDILINNSGMISSAEKVTNNSVETISQKALRQTFDVNFFGAVELTHELLPLIKKSNAGRIVNVSSIMGSLTYQSATDGYKPFAYNASKSALNQFTIHLAAALKNTSIKVNSAHPGWVKTDMGGPDAPMDAKEGAKTIVRLATLESDGPTGKFFHLDEEIAW